MFKPHSIFKVKTFFLYLRTLNYFLCSFFLFFLLKGDTSLNNKSYKRSSGNRNSNLLREIPREESPKSPWWNAPKIRTTLLQFYVINPIKGTHTLKLEMILYHYMYPIHLFTPYERVDIYIRYMIDFLLTLEKPAFDDNFVCQLSSNKSFGRSLRDQQLLMHHLQSLLTLHSTLSL